MVLQNCPECAAQVSSLAVTCPSCGCPVAVGPSQVQATTKKQSKPARHIATVPGCLLILLACMGITVIASRSPPSNDRPKQQAPARPTTARKPTPPLPSFDAQLAAQGKELHASLLAEANVHEFYRAGSLFGSVTREPKASIAVPLDAWRALNDDERAELMHYAASLVESMRKDPLTYSQIPASAPAAGMVRENASMMSPRSWVIHGGRLNRESGTGSFDILTDEAVASGLEYVLAPKRDLAAPEEVISQLRAAGLRADSPWRRSNYDGVWNSVSRAMFGDNEVSCLLESRSQGTIEVVEVEAEVHRPGQREADVFRAFAQAAQALCNEPGLLDAIEARANWTSGKWQLKREPYADGGGFGLTLRYR
jgi:hypothetical protein